jgi:lysozyme
MKIGEKGLALLKLWEQGPKGGFASNSYKCSAGKDTIGWGHVIKPTDNIKQPITLAQAEELLQNDIKRAEEAVNKNVKVTLTQNQFDALVCFVFNIGPTNFKTSTLLKFINEELWNKIPTQFMRWVYSNKVFIKGLENRRKVEVSLWNDKTINDNGGKLMVNFLLSNLKSIGLSIWGVFTLYILGKNSKLSKQNDELNLDVKEQSKTIEIKDKVINVVQNTKPTDIDGNIERMRNKKL